MYFVFFRLSRFYGLSFSKQMIMTRLCIYKIFFTFLLLLFVSSTATFASERILVRVGYVPEYGMISDLEAVDRKGYGFDILKRIEEHSNLLFEFYPFAPDKVVDALENKEIDIYGPVFSSFSYNPNFNLIPTPIGFAQGVLASKSNHTIFYNDLQAINNSTVSLANDYPFINEFKNFLNRNNINVGFVYGTRDSFEHANADFYLTSDISETFHNYKNALSLPIKEMYLLGHADNLSLNEELNSAIKDLTTFDRNFIEKTFLHYYENTNINKKYLSKSESSFLKGKTLRVGYTHDHAPIAFTNEAGKPDGIEIDILNYLADKHDFKLEYIVYSPETDKNNNTKFDILLSIKDDYSDIHKLFDQTVSFLRLPLVLMLNVPEDTFFDKNAELEIGMYNYTTLDFSKIKKEFPNSSIYTFNSLQEAFSSYAAGDFTAGLLTQTGAEHVYSVFGTDETQIIGIETQLPLRLFISKEISHEFLAPLNTAINYLDETTVNEIVSRQTFAFTNQDTILSFIMNNITSIIISILVLLLLVVIAILYEHKSKRQQIQKVINTDSLTGLISLYYFRELMKEMLSSAEPNEYEVFTIDIDYFRIINNIYGFETGSDTIRAIAHGLQEAYPGKDVLISRISGDLFVVLHKYDEEHDPLYNCYKLIIPAIEKVVGKNYSLSMSIGSYRVDDCKRDVNAIIDRANIARLSGKKEHTFTSKTFDAAMHKAFEKQTDIVFRMEKAIKEKEFVIYFQPKIDYNNLQIEGAEALVRWFPQNAAVFYPDEFIPVFEANGFILNLDFYVFEEVLRFIRDNQEHNLPLISINISGRTLYDPSTPFKLLGLLKKYHVSPSQVEVEVTESAILDNDKFMATKVDELKKIGISVSMDDFGAGVSSLNRLSTLNIDTIKLDKSFLDYNSQVSKGSIIVENIVRMAKDLDMKVVTEGVENAGQAFWLKTIGCHLAQGYYFEKPMPTDAFIELLVLNKKYQIKNEECHCDL